jgi:hypothetical protein
MTVTPGNGAHRKQHYADLAGLAQAAGAFPVYVIPGARKPESAYLLRRFDTPAQRPGRQNRVRTFLARHAGSGMTVTREVEG